MTSPCTWGFMRPVLVLPASGAAWSEAERRYAVIHELAHIGRRDYVSAFVSRLACALHWYNPLVWYAARQVHELQERACDDAVLRAGGMPSEYARLLVDIAAQCRNSGGFLGAAVGMAQRSSLRDRVIAILDPRRAREAPSGLSAAAMFVPLSCLMVFLASAALIDPSDALAVDAAGTQARPLAAAAPPSHVNAPEAGRAHHSRRRHDRAIVPGVAGAPAVQGVPGVRAVAGVDGVPGVPGVPAAGGMPAIPAIPPVPAIPAVPAVPSMPMVPTMRSD